MATNQIANNSILTLDLGLKGGNDVKIVVKGLNYRKVLILTEISLEDYNDGFPEKGDWQTKSFTKDRNA
jgi:hypothetical protein